MADKSRLPDPDAIPTPADDIHLKQALGPWTLWGLGVGYVISGEYFGWNLGLPEGGTFGLLIAFVLVTIMYITFTFSYAEMACAIPRAGGVFVHGSRGLGLRAGFLAGIAQAVEYLFVPPAIAMAIGDYSAIWIPGIDARLTAVLAFLAFTALNIWGVRQAAIFELVVSVLAVGELLLFTGVVLPKFEWSHFASNGWPNGGWGVIAALPFAIWFYLGIEGVANAAEEARHPRRDVPIGFGSALVTLVILALCVFVASVGVGGWERIVYAPEFLATSASGQVQILEGAKTSDKPLPLALGQVVSPAHPMYHLLVGIGLLGLIASFNGMILAAGRAVFEMGREGFLPHILGHTHPRMRTPVNALLLNMVIGLVSILFLDTSGLITMSVLGAVTLYALAMLSLLGLRRKEPELERPWKTPGYPAVPLVALALALVSFVVIWVQTTWQAKGWSDQVGLWYLAILALAWLYYHQVSRPRISAKDLEHLKNLDS